MHIECRTRALCDYKEREKKERLEEACRQRRDLYHFRLWLMEKLEVPEWEACRVNELTIHIPGIDVTVYDRYDGDNELVAPNAPTRSADIVLTYLPHRNYCRGEILTHGSGDTGYTATHGQITSLEDLGNWIAAIERGEAYD